MYYYTCNGLQTWYPCNGETLTAAKRQATQSTKGFGLTAGVVRVGIRVPNQPMRTLARKEAMFGDNWQVVHND